MTVVVWNMRLGGEQMQTTCEVDVGIPGGGGEIPVLTEKVGALADFWENGLAFLMTDELLLESISFDGEDYPFTRTGSITRECVPSLVAVVMRKKVVGGNSGRFYMPGVTDANVDNAGRLDAAFRSAFATAMANALTALDNEGVLLQVKQKDGSVLPVVDVTVAPIVGRQSRRLATA